MRNRLLEFSADGRWLAVGGGDDVRLFETRSWSRVAVIAGPGIRSLSWDPTSPRLVTGTVRGDATIWEAPGGALVRQLRGAGEPVDAVAFSPDGATVGTASRDGAEQVWDAGSGALRHEANYLHGKILSIAFDRTSKIIAAAGSTGAVVISDAALTMPIALFEGHRSAATGVHFDPSSHRVVTSSWDGTARVWDATAPYRRWSSEPIDKECLITASLEPDQRFLAVGCGGHPTRVWGTAHDELPSVTPVEGDFTGAFPAVDTNGDRAAIARGNTVEIYELPGGRLLRTIKHVGAVNAVAFAPVGHDLVSGAIDGSLLVTRDGCEPLALASASGGIDAATILSDGRVVAADARSHLRIYDARGGGTLRVELETPTRVRTLRSSPDGLRLLTIPSNTGKAAPPLLWDLKHGRIVGALEGHVGQVFSARFVASSIVTAGGDGTARVWDELTGQLRQTYRGSRRFLVDATISPDGSMVLAGGADGYLRFWDVASARMIWALQAHRSYVVGVHFEGNDLVTRGFSGDVARWSLPTPAAVIDACGLASEESAGDGQPCVIFPR